MFTLLSWFVFALGYKPGKVGALAIAKCVYHLVDVDGSAGEARSEDVGAVTGCCPVCAFREPITYIFVGNRLRLTTP